MKIGQLLVHAREFACANITEPQSADLAGLALEKLARCVLNAYLARASGHFAIKVCYRDGTLTKVFVATDEEARTS